MVSTGLTGDWAGIDFPAKFHLAVLSADGWLQKGSRADKEVATLRGDQ